MKKLQNFVTPLHQATERNYLERMVNEKVHCMGIAEKYEEDYWDGDRRFGYGGYRYIAGYWAPVAQKLIAEYNLCSRSSVLDIGCGKGFLLHEIKNLIPDIRITGIDVSKHGIHSSTGLIKNDLKFHDARTPLDFDDNEFDLAISLATFHNFRLPELEVALSEISRVGRQCYVMVESYRNNYELFNLQCWALTAKTFLDPDEWVWLFERFEYFGDYEFIYFN